MKVSFIPIEKALSSLERALAQDLNEYIRDSCIQRFEYAFELAWKTGMKVLRELGIESKNPRSVVRDLGPQGLIDNVEIWLTFIEKRNLTAYTYKEETANDVYQSARHFAVECRSLVEKLKAR